MTQESDFKFISIEDDDDEIVIQAGVAPSASTNGPVSPAFDDEDLAGEFDEQAEEGFGSWDDEGASVEFSEEDEADAVEREKFEREKARRKARAEANRMITTEDDLKASVPFAGMQRVIIIVAILLILVFIAYFKFGSM